MINVLLIGDSICQGYSEYVREELYGIARVYAPFDNARFTTYQLKYLNDWIGEVTKDGNLDVVCFNSGLWDCLRIDGEEPLVDIHQYLENIRRIIRRIKTKCPKTSIFFATTTKVLREGQRDDFIRIDDDVQAYNSGLIKAAHEGDIEIIDLYSVTNQKGFREHKADGIHFTEYGYKTIAEKVSESILKALFNNENSKRRIENEFDYYGSRSIEMISPPNTTTHKRFVVYGYGKYGAYVIRKISQYFPDNKCVVIDRSPSKIGNMTLEGLSVISLSEYIDMRQVDDIVIISLTDTEAAEMTRGVFAKWGMNVFGIFDFQYWLLHAKGLIDD